MMLKNVISPKTALVSALRKAASTCDSVEDFAGEHDPNHSSLIAFALHFEVILLFAALDSNGAHGKQGAMTAIPCQCSS